MNKEITTSTQDKPEKLSLRAAFTEKMVAALKENKIPWRQPWTGRGSPHNAVTEQPYKGGNRLILALSGMEHGYTDPRYLTFNQAKTLGGSVRKGEGATAIEYWENKPFYTRKDVTLISNGKPIYVDPKREVVGDSVPVKGGAGFLSVSKNSVIAEHGGKKYSWRQAESGLNLLVAKTHFLFNVQQCDGLELKPLSNGVDIGHEARGEQIARGMARDGVPIMHGAGGAYYQPGADVVSMPPRETFKSVEGYYGTLLHELGHATGHAKRLNREGVTKGGLTNSFGMPGYAKEELVAEMTSAFIAMETGIPFDDDNHKAYIQSWAEVLSKDENAIFKAAKDAGAAADYMLAKESLIIEHEHDVCGRMNAKEEVCRVETLVCGEGLAALNESVPEVPKSTESKRQPWRVSRNSSDEMSR
jgi:antirestriction protein ArdC